MREKLIRTVSPKCTGLTFTIGSITPLSIYRRAAVPTQRFPATKNFHISPCIFVAMMIILSGVRVYVSIMMQYIIL
ncbi:hypothetical protein CLOLEP_03942 [[Clostridium] leptum DSM 753]|uniref:Uncharacterized protein n=1 Tax=[Clostridium] leptum DSM 753 TaxID=428125 RepID=A7VZB2_9FIRM|nr:hypothetical protein CLOLEP_03942 [[Clostridium] leptum DSM 753]